MKLMVVFNAHAAAGRSSRLRERIESRMRDLGMSPVVRLTHGPGHAIECVAEANFDGLDGLVAVGGDGTLFEVLNGLYARPESDRPPLGLVPAGTGNAFARDLGLLSGDWEEALAMISRRQVRQIDVGHVLTAGDEFRFLNIIGMGFAVDAGRTARKLKFLGNAAYTMGTLWQVLRLGSYPLDIEIDGERLRQENVFVEISNTRYTGTKFMIAPEARMDDGLLDVTLLRGLGRLRLLRLFPTIYDGSHVEFEEVETRQARHIMIRSPEGMPLAPDGEFRGASPVEIRCLERDLAFFSR